MQNTLDEETHIPLQSLLISITNSMQKTLDEEKLNSISLLICCWTFSETCFGGGRQHCIPILIGFYQEFNATRFGGGVPHVIIILIVLD
jgi:hypothetical protein